MNILDRTTPPPIRPMEPFRLMRPERRVMANGMPLNVINAGTQDVVRVDVLVACGQCHQTLPLQALFTNRMLREGTRTLTSERIAERLDYYGAWLELSSSVNYGFLTLYSLNKHFGQTFAIVADLLKNPTFPPHELEVVVDANKQTYRVNSTRVEMLARRAMNQALFGGEHPLGIRAQLDDYDRITPELLRTFHTAHYHSGNTSVYASGRVTPDIIRTIERHLGDEPWGEVKPRTQTLLPEPRPTTQKRVFIGREDALQSAVKMASFLMDRHHPDFLKARVMTTLFGGYFGSRLMSNIREEKGYTYGIGAAIVSYPGSSLLVIASECANEHVEPLIREVYHEMDRLCTDLVSPEELEMVQNYMLGDLCRSYEGPFSLPDAWVYADTAGLDESFFERSDEAIRSITREEIRELAQRYLCKEKTIEIVAGKK